MLNNKKKEEEIKLGNAELQRNFESEEIWKRRNLKWA